jgi:hypothetical protein
MGGRRCCCSETECCFCNQCVTCIDEWDVTISGFGDTETSEGYGCWDCDRFDGTYTLSRPSQYDLSSADNCENLSEGTRSNCQWTYNSNFNPSTDSHSLAADCLLSSLAYGDTPYIAWIKQIRLQVFTTSFYANNQYNTGKNFRLGITAARAYDNGTGITDYTELYWRWFPTKSDGTYYGSDDLMPCSSYGFNTTPDWESTEWIPTYPCDPDDVTFTIEVAD